MGPTNVALTKLYQADKALREAQNQLDGASRSVRALERRVKELTEKIAASQNELLQMQSRYGQHDLDIKSRDAHIEKLRTQQQNSKSHKEYQAFLSEINTSKVDKTKVEDEALKVMEQIEAAQKSLGELKTQCDVEKKKLADLAEQLGSRLSELQAEVDRLSPIRDAAAADVPANVLSMFDRLAERFEGEAMGAIGRPDRRVEEYACGACHMGLVVNIYNRLHTRDEIVTCPNCQRMLFIPEDLPINAAIIKRERREPREPRGEKGGPISPAATGRQTSAFDVMRSIDTDPAENANGQPSAPPAESTPPEGAANAAPTPPAAAGPV